MISPKELLKTSAEPVKNLTLQAIILGFFGGLIMISQAWILAIIISDIIIHQKTLSDVWSYILLLPLLFLVRVTFFYFSEMRSFQAASQVKLQMREKLLDHLFNLGPVRLSGEGTGDLVVMLTDGVEGLEAYYSRYLPGMMLTVLLPIAILVVVLPFDWLSAIVMLVTAPLIPFFMIMIGKGTEKLNQQQWAKLARMGKHFLSMIQGLTTLKIFGASKREADAIEQISNDYRLSTMKVLRIAFLSSMVLEFFASIAIAIVAVLIGFRLLWGDMTFYAGFFVLLLAPEFYLPLRQMGANYHARMEAIGAAERMAEILSMEAKESTTDKYAPEAFDIEFKDVSFSYDERAAALKNINVKFKAGEHVALVGASGSGKTTLMNLLLRFIQPSEGDILAGSTPIRDIHRDSWYAKLAWLPQKPTLFQGNIVSNITMGDVSGTDNPIPFEQAAKQAQAHDFISKLDKGYETEIGEQGIGLSGGQMQRIALVRAFIRRANFILLDEPTAHLDTQSEKLIEEALNKVRQTSGSITIAHRLSTIQNADRILVLDQGEIVEQGSHDELLKAGKLYPELVKQYSANWKEDR